MSETRRRWLLFSASYVFSAIVYFSFLAPAGPKCLVDDRPRPQLEQVPKLLAPPSPSPQWTLPVTPDPPPPPDSNLVEAPSLPDYKPPLPTPFLNSNRVAVLVETRLTNLLLPTIDNFATHLPWDWKLLLMISEEAERVVRVAPFLSELIAAGRISIARVPEESRGATGPEEAYQDLLQSEDFWRSLPGERVLMFGTDSVLCRGSKHVINDFVKYDFIGAGWSLKEDKKNTCGQGGLTMRSRTKMIEAIQRFKGRPDLPKWDPEFACQAFQELGAKLPDRNTSLQFAVADNYYEQPFGVYRIHKYFTNRAEELVKLYDYCPEAVAMTDSDQFCNTELSDPLFERHLNLTELCSGFRETE